ncbi:MAG TPA: hypothetical protein PLK71_00600 [Candidatus Paceibacterota bacterium]|nr:hypothetical protein [Candidatus Paceibacterota bacterium]HPB60226.1 hypothetical protein [Candidatus Paceibacterota bacterium]HPI24352.1 hypothetical protein [Candidatus Paceibacterota bacterium]HPN89202.1 hypothetical protein [Candidatus Paceibacterota bacterium]HPY12754.1 hypothetical protein [Candidatus Paceibacterota bacterium]
MDKKFSWLGLAYFLFIVGFPFVTWGGWGFVFFLVFILPILTVLTIITLIKYHKGDQKTGRKWLLLLGGVYAAACLLIIDGADFGDAQGIERLFGHLFRGPVNFIPESIGENLAGVSMFLYLLFFALNIAFITSKPRAKEINKNSTSTSAVVNR